MPTAEFSALPLHAACDSTGRCVADDFVVSYTPSIAAVRPHRPRHERKKMESQHRLLALINPTNDLPFSEEIELPALVGLFPHTSADHMLVGDDAQKERLIALAGNCTHLHLSCHAEFDWRDPRQAGLQLSQNERVTVPEIAAKLDLGRCEVVLLSACETGVADVVFAPDESVGQVAAFRHAGAGCVIASLWAIADNAAALFSQRFYQCNIADGLDPALAAREAVRWLRELTWDEYGSAITSSASLALTLPGFQTRGFPKLAVPSPDLPSRQMRDEKPFASPFYWAAFVTWAFQF